MAKILYDTMIWFAWLPCVITIARFGIFYSFIMALPLAVFLGIVAPRNKTLEWMVCPIIAAIIILVIGLIYFGIAEILHMFI